MFTDLVIKSSLISISEMVKGYLNIPLLGGPIYNDDNSWETQVLTQEEVIKDYEDNFNKGIRSKEWWMLGWNRDLILPTIRLGNRKFYMPVGDKEIPARYCQLPITLTFFSNRFILIDKIEEFFFVSDIAKTGLTNYNPVLNSVKDELGIKINEFDAVDRGYVDRGEVGPISKLSFNMNLEFFLPLELNSKPYNVICNILLKEYGDSEYSNLLNELTISES